MTKPAPYVPPARSVTKVMALVIAAAVPAGLVHTLFFGPGLLVHVVLAALTACAAEALCVRARGGSAQHALRDVSALVCAVLIAFCLPPLAPWYTSVLAAAFAIVVAKHAFGGLGANVFNPAMAGYVMVLLAFPEAMTRWPAIGETAPPWATQLALIFAPGSGDVAWDTLTMATPLDQLRSELGRMRMMSEVLADGSLPGRTGWIAFQIAALIGGVAMLALKVIRWHLPVAMLGGVIVAAGLLHIIDADRFAGALFQLGAGGTVFAAFFVVTDPVSAATSPRGRLIFGFGVGVLAVAIRTLGAYPDGTAFAVLLMNAAVPLIDRFTAPRVYGHNPPRPDTLP